MKRADACIILCDKECPDPDAEDEENIMRWTPNIQCLHRTGNLKAGLHVRRKHKHKHKHKPRVNRDDASTSTSARSFFLCLCLRYPGSHVAYACACVLRVNKSLRPVYTCDFWCNFWCDFAYKTLLTLPYTNAFFAKHRVDWRESYHMFFSRHPSFQFLLTWRYFVAALRD